MITYGHMIGGGSTGMGQTDRVDTLGANGGEGFGSGEVHFQLGVLQPTLGQSPPRLEPDAGLPFLHLKHTCNSFHYNIANSENLPIHFFTKCFHGMKYHVNGSGPVVV